MREFTWISSASVKRLPAKDCLMASNRVVQKPAKAPSFPGLAKPKPEFPPTKIEAERQTKDKTSQQTQVATAGTLPNELSLEEGTGKPITLLHVSDIGSHSADDWRTEDTVDFSRAYACFPPSLNSGLEGPLVRPGGYKVEPEAEILGVPHHGTSGARYDDFLTQVAEASVIRYDSASVKEVLAERRSPSISSWYFS
jgi:hypothetical protein